MLQANETIQPITPTASDGLEAPRRYWAVATMSAAVIFTSLDITMANVALPVMAKDLHISPGVIVWVMIAYSLTVVVSLLPLAAVAERIGFRRMFTLGVTIFMFSALACSLSSSFIGLIVARIVQGFGTAMLMCLFGGLLRHMYPLRKLGFGISLNSMVVGSMAVLGPTIGAFILEVTSWRWIFAMYTPICLIAYLGVRFLPDGVRVKRRFDWVACILSVLLFGSAIVGLDTLATSPWTALACFAVTGLAALALMRHSRDQAAPLVPIDLLRIKPVRFAIAASSFSFAAQMSSFVALPFYFLNVMGHTYAEVGILLGAWSIGVAVMAPIAGYLADKYLVAVLCAIGATCMTLGLTWVALLPLDVRLVWIVLAMLLGGVGFGFFQSPNNRAMLGGAPKRRSGAAGGLQATTRVFGQSFGTALVALAFNLSTAHGATFGIVVAIGCSLMALIINIVRYFSPIPDLDL